jgi:hypothetical protein
VPQKIRTGTLAGAGVPSLSITFPEIKMGIAFTELFVVLLAGWFGDGCGVADG